MATGHITVTMGFTIKSDNSLSKLKARLQKYSGTYTVEAGFPASVASTLHANTRSAFYRDEDRSDSPQSLGKIAYKLNYGGIAYQLRHGRWRLIDIPARPFMEISAQSVGQLKPFIKNALSAVNKSEGMDEALNLVGEAYTQLIQKTMTELNDPGNSETTIFIKKSSNPLIDTGQLRNSVSYEVKKE